MALFRKKRKEINVESLEKAICHCFKDYLRPDASGTHIIKRYVEINRDICVKLESVCYYEDSTGEHLSAHVSISADYVKNFGEYMCTVAKYTMRFDTERDSWTSTCDYIDERWNDKFDLLNKWSEYYMDNNAGEKN